MDRKTTEELQEHMFGRISASASGSRRSGARSRRRTRRRRHAPPRLDRGLDQRLLPHPSPPRLLHHAGPLRRVPPRRGACLYVYKGFSDKENVALNMAGVFAALVALLPTAAEGSDRGPVSMLHATSAVLFFLCIAYVSLFRSHDTLRSCRKRAGSEYERLYVWTGRTMVASPLAAVVLTFAFGTRHAYLLGRRRSGCGRSPRTGSSRRSRCATAGGEARSGRRAAPRGCPRTPSEKPMQRASVER